MGVKNLFRLIQALAPSSISLKSLSRYKGKRVALDASLIIYQYVIAIRSQGKDLVDSEGRMTSHIHAVFSKAIMLLKHGIVPTFVFDGAPPDIKLDTLAARRKIKDDAAEKLDLIMKDGYDSNNEVAKQEKIKHWKRTVSFSTAQMEDCKKLLSLMGVPFVQAEGEADSEIAQLVKDKQVDAAASEDMDTLTFGSPIMLRDFSPKKKFVKEIRLSKVLKELQLSHIQFVDLCILLGSDYAPTIKGIGSQGAYRLIKKYGSIPAILKWIQGKNKTQYTIPDGYPEIYKKTREYFLHAPVIENENIVITLKTPQKEKLTKFLTKHGFGEKIIKNKIKHLTLLNKQLGGTQDDVDPAFLNKMMVKKV